MWTRRNLKARAKASLKKTYWKAFLVSLLLAFFGGGGCGSYKWNFGGSLSDQNLPSDTPVTDPFSTLPGWMWGVFALIFLVVIGIFLLIRIFLGFPLEVGGRRYFVQAAQQDVRLNNLGYAFDRGRYMDTIKAMFWRALLNFLWYLLLIIPGIIKAYSYRLVPYILADNPNIGSRRAVDLSRQMMNGHKFRVFVLDLSFIGWFLLGLLALLLGALFVLPYYNATMAELYLSLRREAWEHGTCTPEELSCEAVS